jgi:hypothetical protein
MDLFDYLTVQSPGNDYLPNAPLPYPGTDREPIDNDGDTRVGDIDNAPAPPGTPTPPFTAQGPGLEDTLPVQGLININTAPAKTLSALPFVSLANRATPTDRPGDRFTWTPIPGLPVGNGTWTAGADGEDDNVTLAREIVRWRDGAPGRTTPPLMPSVEPQGPFRTIWDLYRVPAFRNLQDALYAGTTEPDDADGDFSPWNNAPTPPPVTADTVRGDFEEQNILLTRVSNLITTRSDSFTVYLVVQGWANAGQANAELVVQRRAAFIIDRSSVTNTNSTPEIHMIPND